MAFKLGLIGCGKIAQSYIEAIEKSTRVRLCAVCDIRQQTAVAVAEQTGAIPYSRLSDYLKKSGVEGSIVCTPPQLHREISCSLLEAGQHVLCEKPLATTLKEGKQMLKTAKASGRLLMMASKFRYVEDVIRSKALLASGLVGKVLFYENAFSGFLDLQGRWNAEKKISGGGVLIDNGTHAVDVVRYLLGPLQSVKTIDASARPGLEVEDTILLSFVTQDQVKGNILLSWNVELDRNAYISVYGSSGQLRLNWDKSSYRLRDRSEWIDYGKGYHKIDAFQRQVENFVAAVLGEEPPLISEKGSLASLAAIDAAYRSLKSGKWEQVEDAIP